MAPARCCAVALLAAPWAPRFQSRRRSVPLPPGLCKASLSFDLPSHLPSRTYAVGNAAVNCPRESWGVKGDTFPQRLDGAGAAYRFVSASVAAVAQGVARGHGFEFYVGAASADFRAVFWRKRGQREFGGGWRCRSRLREPGERWFSEQHVWERCWRRRWWWHGGEWRSRRQ